jgi:hypothetical protein
VFVWEKLLLDQHGKLIQDYLKNCRALLAEGKLTNIRDDEAVNYMNLLWDAMTKDKCYMSWLASNHSNMYQVMQNRFISELQWLIMHCHLGQLRFPHSLLCVCATQSCAKSATAMEWCSWHWRALLSDGGCQR